MNDFTFAVKKKTRTGKEFEFVFKKPVVIAHESDTFEGLFYNLFFDFKVTGVLENTENDGFFRQSARFIRFGVKAIAFDGEQLTVEGRQVTSIDLEDDIFSQLEGIYEELVAKEEGTVYKGALSMKVLRKWQEGDDLFARVKMKRERTGQEMEFECVNQFDAGYGVYRVGGESDLEFEQDCEEYIESHSPIPTYMRL